MFVLWIIISLIAIALVVAAVAIIPALLRKEEDDGLDELTVEEARRRLGLDRPESIERLPIHPVTRVNHDSEYDPSDSWFDDYTEDDCVEDDYVEPKDQESLSEWVKYYWIEMPLSDTVAHKVGKQLAKQFRDNQYVVMYDGEIPCFVGNDLSLLCYDNGEVICPFPDSLDFFYENRVRASHFLADPYEYFLDDFHLGKRILDSLKTKPKTNALWLVEQESAYLYDLDKWENRLFKRSHCPKSRKDREGKSWQSFDGRHMNCRKKLADDLNVCSEDLAECGE